MEHGVLRPKELEKALMLKGYPKEGAEKIAACTLNFFGYADRFNDALLRPDDRDIMNILLDEGYSVTREEVLDCVPVYWNRRKKKTIRNVQGFRIYWMILKIRDIKRAAREYDRLLDVPPEINDGREVYSEIPEEAWTRRTHELTTSHG